MLFCGIDGHKPAFDRANLLDSSCHNDSHHPLTKPPVQTSAAQVFNGCSLLTNRTAHGTAPLLYHRTFGSLNLFVCGNRETNVFAFDLNRERNVLVRFVADEQAAQQWD